ncbi:MAG TPA: carbohydrate-binding protein, partial [Longimicrobiaceae bacterium]
DFRYANGSTADRPLELRVNGAVALPRLSFAPTGKWSAWGTATAMVTLAAGANRIRLTSVGSNGPNLDAVTVSQSADA